MNSDRLKRKVKFYTAEGSITHARNYFLWMLNASKSSKKSLKSLSQTKNKWFSLASKIVVNFSSSKFFHLFLIGFYFKFSRKNALKPKHLKLLWNVKNVMFPTHQRTRWTRITISSYGNLKSTFFKSPNVRIIMQAIKIKRSSSRGEQRFIFCKKKS